MMLHASLFWLLVFLSIYKILGKFDVEWATLFQWWWWNLFAYLYVAFMHFIAVNKKSLEMIRLKIRRFHQKIPL